MADYAIAPPSLNFDTPAGKTRSDVQACYSAVGLDGEGASQSRTGFFQQATTRCEELGLQHAALTSKDARLATSLDDTSRLKATKLGRERPTHCHQVSLRDGPNLVRRTRGYMSYCGARTRSPSPVERPTYCARATWTDRPPPRPVRSPCPPTLL